MSHPAHCASSSFQEPTCSTITRAYQVRFGEVAASEFQNDLLVFNPAYSNRHVALGPRKTAALAAMKLKLRRWPPRDQSLLKSMAASIAQDGLFNPLYAIQARAGLYIACGTRRIICCKWLDLKAIPTVIADYTDKWKDFEELTTKEEIFRKFRDPPEIFTMESDWLFMDKLADSAAYTLR